MTVETATNRESILARAFAILLKPGATWPTIAAEDASSRDVFMSYVLPLSLIGPLCGLIGGQVFGYEGFGLQQPSLFSAVIGALVTLAVTLFTFMILTFIADSLSPRFGGERNSWRAAKLVAYATTPVWLAGVFALVPKLAFLGVLAIYGAVLIFTGATPMLKVPREKAGGYTLAFVVCALVLNGAALAFGMANMAILHDMGLLG